MDMTIQESVFADGQLTSSRDPRAHLGYATRIAPTAVQAKSVLKPATGTPFGAVATRLLGIRSRGKPD